MGTDTVERRLDGGQLRQNLLAVFPFFNHATQPPHLAFYARQPVQDPAHLLVDHARRASGAGYHSRPPTRPSIMVMIPLGVPSRQGASAPMRRKRGKNGAEYGVRTRDIQLGKLALYQLS